ncbi:hypothetical protein [Streptomyces zaomyceticus]
MPGRDVGVFVVFNGDGTDGRAAWDAKDLINRVVDALVPRSQPWARPCSA